MPSARPSVYGTRSVPTTIKDGQECPSYKPLKTVKLLFLLRGRNEDTAQQRFRHEQVKIDLHARIVGAEINCRAESGDRLDEFLLFGEDRAQVIVRVEIHPAYRPPEP